MEWVADLPGANLAGGTTISGWARRVACGTSNGRQIDPGNGGGAGQGDHRRLPDLAVERNSRRCSWKALRMWIKKRWRRFSPTRTPIGLSDGGRTCSSMGAGYSTRLGLLGARGHHIPGAGSAAADLRVRVDFGIYDRGCSVRGWRDITFLIRHCESAAGRHRARPAGAGARTSQGHSLHDRQWQVLLEDGRHTGALPGRVLRNTLYHETATA